MVSSVSEEQFVMQHSHFSSSSATDVRCNRVRTVDIVHGTVYQRRACTRHVLRATEGG